MTNPDTPEAVERLCNLLDDKARAEGFKGDRAAEMIRALAARVEKLEATPVPVAVIRDLEWTPTIIKGEHLRDTAKDMDGRLRYEVGGVEGNHYLIINLPKGGLESRGNYPSEEAAKAAAQADYTRRILSALNLRTADDVREECAKICDRICNDFEDEWRKGRKCDTHMEGMSDGASDCAAAIRASKGSA